MSSSSPRHELITYKISYNTALQDEKYGITDSVRSLLEDVFFDVGKGKKSTIKRLHRAIKKYPKVPQFKNYLTKEYVAAGNESKADEVTDWILEAHPDYLFGKVNKAHSLMQKEKAELVPELLGEAMDLQALYPEREEFHIDEVLSFYMTTVFYFLEVDDREEAGKRLELLEELDAHSNQTKQARNRVMLFDMKSNMEKGLQTGEHDRRIERTVTSRSYRKSTQTDVKPRFHHSETELLYTTGIKITDDQIGQILSLPKKTLAEDLEAVLEDTINRFEVYKEKMREEGWVENEYDFSLHAIAFLAELKSEQSLPNVLELFRQGDEFLDFWYGDRFEEFFEAPVAALAQNQLHVLRDFLKEPGNSYYARNIAVSAAEYIASTDPAKRESVIELLEEWIHFLLDHEQDDMIFDTNLLGFIVWSCVNLKTKKLLGLIKTLYEKDFIPLLMVGSYEDVEFDILRDEHLPVKDPFEIYSYYQKIENNPLFKSDEIPPEPPLPASPTIPLFPGEGNHSEPAVNPWKDVGRNDPCPCGSGRKYKKCCLR